MHCLMTGDENWIRHDNPKRRKSWNKPEHELKFNGKPNINGSDILLYIWVNQLSVVLQCAQTEQNHHYQLQLMGFSRTLKENFSRTLKEFITTVAAKLRGPALGDMLRFRWKLTWKRLNGKSYPTRSTQRSLLLIIICTNRWRMAWLSNTFIIMKTPINVLTIW